MKISLEKPIFLKALFHGQSVVEKKTTIPVLSHVLLSATKQELSITSTDLDIALIETFPIQVEAPGSLCVSAHLLYEIVRKLSDEVPITLTYEGTLLVVQSGRSRFDLPCLPAEDFPQLTHSELTHHFFLPAPVLKHLIDSSRFAMSTEEKRYNLSGIFFHTVFEGSQEILRAVAADLYRLACIGCEVPSGSQGMPGIIVGRKTVTEIRKLLDEAESPVSIGLSSTRIEFSVETDKVKSTLSSRLVEGVFPDYQEALNVSNDKVMIANTKMLSEVVDRVGTVVSDKVRAIRLSLSANMASFSAVSSDLGSAKEEMDVDFSCTDSIDICFNVRYLMDITQQVPTEEVEFLIQDGASSILIKPVGGKLTTFVLMPMNA